MALTKSMLKDLNKGCASIKIITIPTITSSSTIADYKFPDSVDALYTKDGSLSIAQEGHSETDYKLDQFREIFDTDFETGKFAIKGFIPCTNDELLNYFFKALVSSGGTPWEVTVGGTTASPVTMKARTGFDVKVNPINKAMLIKSESEETGLIFTNVRLAATLGEQDRYRGVSFSGTVLPSGFSNIAAFYPLDNNA